MPYINIREEDITPLSSFDTVENAVLVFGFDFSRVNGGSSVFEDGYKLYTSLTEFIRDINKNLTLSDKSLLDLDNEVSELVLRPLITAYDCLANGLPVMYMPIDGTIDDKLTIKISEEKHTRTIYHYQGPYPTSNPMNTYSDETGELPVGSEGYPSPDFKHYIKISDSETAWYAEADPYTTTEDIITRQNKSYVEYLWLSDSEAVPDVPDTEDEFNASYWGKVGLHFSTERDKALGIYKNYKTIGTYAAQKALGNLLASSEGVSYDLFSDKVNFPITFITTCGYEDCTNSNIPNYNSLIMGAIKRADLVYLYDIPSTVKPEDTLVLTKFKPSITAAELTAIIYPWATFNSYFGVSNIHMPGSYGYLMAYANSIKNNRPWLAAAGINRGAIPNIVNIDYKVREAFIHSWQGDEEASNVPSFRINPIVDFGSVYGKVIFGNRTCKASAPGAITFGDFLNVRLLLAYIHKQAFNSSIQHMFEPNDDIVWLSFKQKVNDLLDRMVSGRGIKWYKWYKIKTDKLGMIKAKLTIRPIEAVESFDILISMTESDIEVEVR